MCADNLQPLFTEAAIFPRYYQMSVFRGTPSSSLIGGHIHKRTHTHARPGPPHRSDPVITARLWLQDFKIGAQAKNASRSL